MIGISSIEYLREIPGVLVVDNRENLYMALRAALSDKNELIKNAHMIRNYATEKHDIKFVRSALRRDFISLLGGEGS